MTYDLCKFYLICLGWKHHTSYQMFSFLCNSRNISNMAEKESRTTAKRKFTLGKKGSISAIEEDVSIDIISNSFKRLNELWINAQDAHEVYVRTLNLASDAQDEDDWINDVFDQFRDAERKYHEYIDNRRKAEEVDMKEISTVERLHNDRRLKELKFQNHVGLLNELLDSANISCATEVIKDAYNDVKAVYRSVNSSHENYVLSLGSNKAAGEFNWIERIQALYRDMSVRYGERLDLLENKNNVPTSKNTFK